MGIYLVTYHPLIAKQSGREAIKQYGFPPYVDGSCRREPDFESPYPSISALCCGRNFAPRLHVGDVSIYITCVGKYPDFKEPHWRLTAILEILTDFTSHQKAAEFYYARQLTLPSNCIVPNNPPLSLDKTIRHLPETDFMKFPVKYAKRQLPLLNSNPALDEWDRRYQERAKKWGAFLICTPLFRELNKPPIVTREIMLKAFNKIPATRTPPVISAESFEKLIYLCGIEIN